ncbi:MAG TPA: cell wall-active antibiotics response protein LiaF [Bacteroidota bacterium]|jgi:predicted membrane protein
MRNLYWGFILIIIGILILLDNLGVADFGDVMSNFWPLILVFWGLAILLRKRSISQVPGPAGYPQSAAQQPGSQPGGFVGGETQQTEPGDTGSEQQGSYQPPSSAGGPNQSASELLHQSSAFGDISVNVTSTHFRGGSISTVFGGSNLDLSAAGIAEGEHELRIHGVFGESRLVLPRDAAVAISASSVFGDLMILGQRKGGISTEIQHVTPNYATATNRLKVTITRVFGSIRVE